MHVQNLKLKKIGIIVMGGSQEAFLLDAHIEASLEAFLN
jgi:hypothetical protein